MDDLKTMQALGIDLGDRAAVDKAASDAAAEAAARKEQAELLALAQRWDKMMQRAFKGIYPRPLRHKMMKRNVERREREQAAREAAERAEAEKGAWS